LIAEALGATLRITVETVEEFGEHLQTEVGLSKPLSARIASKLNGLAKQVPWARPQPESSQTASIGPKRKVGKPPVALAEDGTIAPNRRVPRHPPSRTVGLGITRKSDGYQRATTKALAFVL
jgi:hypothetical protein